jgi:F-type H+-transporting ATPase subunit b
MATQLTVILASGSLVDIDGTLFIQLGIFLFMLVVLRTLLFKPVIRLIEARHEATVGTMKTAADLQKEAAALTADVTAKLLKVRAEASADRTATVDRAKRTEREIVTAAKEKTHGVMTQMRAQAATEMKETQNKLEQETRTMAALLAEKVLDRQL